MIDLSLELKKLVFLTYYITAETHTNLPIFLRTLDLNSILI